MGCYLVSKEHYDAAVEADFGLAELCCYNRINTLAQIYNAQHGWLGASLSMTELLTTLYFDRIEFSDDPASRDSVLLGKGHGAAMQYAALAGIGAIDAAELARYKEPDGPQAHTDLMTSGIEINSGSLGMALSKGCGLAKANPDRRVYVILGDGEMQEGQNYEALMTLNHYRLDNLTLIIDQNSIQSDSNVRDIMAVPDFKPMLESFGISARVINGSSLEEVKDGFEWAESNSGPSAIIAQTKKGAGISFMESADTERRAYAWHGGPPNRDQYLDALNELAGKLKSETVQKEIAAFAESHEGPKGCTSAPKAGSTGEAFGSALVDAAGNNSDIVALDADLEKPCNMVEFAKVHPEQYIEMGISEQDMVSFAGGLALRGKLPVVNTYAAFYRRCFEQVYINSTEKSRVLYAGHYAGLCYESDGKSHTCTGDVAMMRSIPGLNVLYPVFPEEIPGMLNWFTSEDNGPLYMRLHRSGADISFDGSREFLFGRAFHLRDNGADTAVLTCGPHMSAFASAAIDSLEVKRDLFAFSTLRGLDGGFIGELLSRYSSFIVVEECCGAGGFFDEFCGTAAGLTENGASMPRIIRRAVDGLPFSSLGRFELYRHFGLDHDALAVFFSSEVSEG